MASNFAPADAVREKRPAAANTQPGRCLAVNAADQWALAGNGSQEPLIIAEPDYSAGKAADDVHTAGSQVVGARIKIGEVGVAFVSISGAAAAGTKLAHGADGVLDAGSAGNHLCAELAEDHSGGLALRRVRGFAGVHA